MLTTGEKQTLSQLLGNLQVTLFVPKLTNLGAINTTSKIYVIKVPTSTIVIPLCYLLLSVAATEM